MVLVFIINFTLGFGVLLLFFVFFLFLLYVELTSGTTDSRLESEELIKSRHEKYRRQNIERKSIQNNFDIVFYDFKQTLQENLN